MVIWTPNDVQKYFGGQNDEPENLPLELYLEGDIVFREGDRVVYAQSMYYNVPARTGTILNAEAITPVQNYAGALRLRANVLRQVGVDQFVAEGASVTTSRLAMPTYEFRSGLLTLVDSQVPEVNPITGAPDYRSPNRRRCQAAFANGHQHQQCRVRRRDPGVLLADAGHRRREADVLHSKGHRQKRQHLWHVDRDRVGFVPASGLANAAQRNRLGVESRLPEQPRTAAGTKFTYDNDFLFNRPERTFGLVDAWFIHDGGLDTLGRDRVNILPEPETDFRGRLLARIVRNCRIIGS